MQKVLVSACLLGEPVRYDGRAATLSHPLLSAWRAEGRIVACCPELEGGLAVPRPPAESTGDGGAVLDGQARIRDASGADLTAPFVAGAHAAVEVCRKLGIQVAVLMERSPSCGSGRIYDGAFSGRLVSGQGVAAAALRAAGVAVFPGEDLEGARARLSELEGTDALGGASDPRA